MIITSAGLMVRANAFVAVTLLLSVTWMVKVAVAVAAGWPPIAPVAEFNERPLGSDPAVTNQVYCPLPPVAVRVCE